jgi:hypothetical protein
MNSIRIFVIFFIACNILNADWHWRYNTIGQWEIAETNWGAIGGFSWPLDGYWPRASGHKYIYGAGIWVGGVLPNGDTVVTVGYGPQGSDWECAPGLPYTDPADPQWRVYLSTDPVYQFPLLSVEDGYAIYNDFDTVWHMPDSFHVPEPLGITITQKTHVWPIEWATDVVLIQYIVRNDTNFTIRDLYVGFCLDFDIGNEGYPYANDRCGIDLSRKMFYGWQDPPEQSWRPGMIGFKLLSPDSLASFKRFTLQTEPEFDRERYLTMAGYDFLTGVYEPYDTVWPAPDDQRIMMTAAPLDSLAPGDSIVIDWALLATTDSIPPSTNLAYKADKIHTSYNTGYHTVDLTSPNGGETVSGNWTITYSANAVTSNPLTMQLYIHTGTTLDTIVINQNNTGWYPWNTTHWPDGVFYRIAVVAYDTATFGNDFSESYFTIDNPGNAAPLLTVFSPQNNDTVSDMYDITWFARDPEFQDSLRIDIFFRSQYSSNFNTVASNEPNDSLYSWHTVGLRNGSGALLVQVSDDSNAVAETLQIYVLNQISAATANHTSGLNNCVELSVLGHVPSLMTGHTYEVQFREHRALRDSLYFARYPEYFYDIVDSNTGSTVLSNYSLIGGYEYYPLHVLINEFSPIIDGFSIWTRSVSEQAISRDNFQNDSVRVAIGSYPQDSISIHEPLGDQWWPYRGARLQVDWVYKTTGGLTLFVTDLDYGDTIPYRAYSSTLNPDSADGWCFHEFFSDPPSDTLRVNDSWIWLCGQRIHFSRSVPVPQVNDRWIVYPSEHAPPIKGNVYRFTPEMGAQENRNACQLLSFQTYPLPFSNMLTIAYALPQTHHVKLKIYDVLGRQVVELADDIQEAGAYRVLWNGYDSKNRKAAAGVYFCRFETGERTMTNKVLLIR